MSLLENAYLYQSGKRTLPEVAMRQGAEMVSPVMSLFGAFIPDLDPRAKMFMDMPMFAAKKELGLDKAVDRLPKFSATPRAQENIQNAMMLGGFLPFQNAVLAANPAHRGMFTSSGNVIVPDYYSGNPYKTVTGFADWGMKGLGDAVRMMFDPQARAKYTETGVNPMPFEDNMRKYRQAQKDYEEGKITSEELTDAKRTAHQQLQATSNIREQANAQAKGYDLTEDAIVNAADVGATTRAGATYWNPKGDTWYDDIVAPSRPNQNTKYDRYTPEDSQTIQNHITRSWGVDPTKEDVKFIVKNSRRISGAHQFDLFNNNKVPNAIARSFKDMAKDNNRFNFKTPQELHDYLVDPKRQFDKDGEKLYTVKFDDPDRIANDGGIWVSGSTVGTAKVEGGVNTLYKVYPDGRIFGVMSDLHDFLEKVPGLGQGLKGALPTKVVAITPPLYGDVWNMKTAGSKKPKNRKKLDTGVVKDESISNFDFYGELLNDISKITASPSEVFKQRMYALANANAMNEFRKAGGMFGGLGQASYEDMMMAP
jgi:hypothetical protein